MSPAGPGPGAHPMEILFLLLLAPALLDAAARAVARRPRARRAGADEGRRRGLAWAVAVGAAAISLLWLMASGRAAADVTPSGSFSTHVAIAVPSFRGIQPGIDLRYDSKAPDGLLGVGWRMDAASYIARTGRNGGAPRYDGSDVFTLDGEELITCTPGCATGGTHETRRRDFTRITFDGTDWTRWLRDGERLHYEPLPLADARGTYRWALSTVTDTHGNVVAYSHDCSGTECYLQTISYADGRRVCRLSGGLPICTSPPEGARIRFHYEDRPDPVSYGTGGDLATTSKRLKTIEVRMAGDLVRAYAFDYQTSTSTGSSLMRSVQTFPSDATVATDGRVVAGATEPQPPTTFSTESMTGSSLQASTPQPLPTGGLSAPITSGDPVLPSVFTNISIPNRAGQRFDQTSGEAFRLSHGSLLGDFDGDGRTDVAFWSMTACSGSMHITTVLADHPQTPVETGPEPDPLAAPPCVNRLSAFAADLNGDGVDDVVVMSRGGAVHQRLGMGGGAFGAGSTLTPTGFDPPRAVGPNRPRCRTGDVDADGRTDVVCLYASAGTGMLGVARTRASGGFDVTKAQLPSGLPPVPNLEFSVGDVDANGTADVVLAAKVGSAWRLTAGSVDTSGSVAFSPLQDTGWSTGLNAHVWDLSSADIDGDGRADVVLTRAQYQGRSRLPMDAVFVATSPKVTRAAAAFAPLPQPTVLAATYTAVGDANGDGRADLMTGAPVGEALASGDGRFAAWASSAPSAAGCGEGSSIFVPGEGIIPDQWVAGEPGQPYSAVDVNGDGRADRLCLGDVDVDDFTAHDVVSPNRPADLHRWIPADVTGTGHQDLVYVAFRNPGYEVHTLTRQASGQFVRTTTAVTSLCGTPPCGTPPTNANAAAWMPVDVGGPGGTPDGKTDLVMVDRSGTTLLVYTLLSTGTGWLPRADTPWRVNGTSAPYGSVDVQHWRPANLNRDGRTDLVHLVPLGPGVQAEHLLSNGDGTWTSGAGPGLFTGAAAGAPALDSGDVQNFLPTDVDGDQVTDFVHTEFNSGKATLRALVGNGDASFSERSHEDPGPWTAAQVRRFQPMDFNGDGMQDLGLVRASRDCLVIAALVSTGTDWTIDEAPPTADCQSAHGIADTNNIRLLDVDHDNRTDVLHLARYLDGGTSRTAAYLSLNRPGQRWPVVNAPPLALPHPDTWAYTSMDTDSDGRAELVHVDGTELAFARIDAASDVLTEIDNGRGGRSHVDYRSLGGARTYLPTGSLPTVVDSVTISDTAYDPPVTETTRWSYDGARWSDRDGRLLGFEKTTSTQGGSVTVTGHWLTDACGARPATTSVQSIQGEVLTSGESGFVDPGQGPSFTCLSNRVVERDCGGDPDCAVKVTESDDAPDPYGNFATTVESGTLAGTRRTTTDFRPNLAAYIVDRPARQQIFALDLTVPRGGQWRLEAATENLYDANTTWDSPPGAPGELRRTRGWDDGTNTFAETFLDYDARGNLTRTTSPTGVVEETLFDPDRSLFPIRICAPPIGCRSQTWNLTYGELDTVTDVNGQVTSYRYDTYGRQTLVTTPDGGTSATAYLDEGRHQGADSQRQRIRTEITDGSRGDGVLWQEELLDGLGRAYKQVREGDGSGAITSETRFTDASDRPAVTVDPHVGCCGAWTEYRYDAAHRLVRVVLPDGATTETEYRPGATVTRDPLDRQTTTVRDEFGRVIRVERLDRHPCANCPPATRTTRYGYDPLNHPVRITDANGNVTETSWDSLGRRTSEHDPDRGLRTWTWRADGAPSSATDAKGQVIRWRYDAAGRLIGRGEYLSGGRIAPSRTITWSWDHDPSDGELHGASLGRLVRVEFGSAEASGSIDNWYDRMGRVERSRQCTDDNCAELGFTFDRAGRLATIAYPDAQRALSNKSERVTQHYDTAGRLDAVTGRDPALPEPDTAYATDVAYDPLGQLTTLRHSNGLVDSLAYDTDDGRHWLDSIEVTNPTTDVALYGASYRHHPDGKLRSQTETPGGLQQEYAYDDLERLSSVTASDPARSRAYTYDAIGRMSSSSTAGTYTYGDLAHLHAPTTTQAGHTRRYNANGDLESLHDPTGRDLTIDWTISGMPQHIVDQASGGSTAVDYGADDQRVVKHDDQGTTYYFGRHLEQDADGRLVKYYWAGDRLIARRDGAGALIDVHPDRLGSTRLLTNAKGSVLETHDYDPFGRPLTPPARDERLWQGRRTDHDSGLAYMNARYYDAELGRFISPDSLIPDLYRPQSLDRYAYTENDPINFTDPSGHMKMQVELKKEQERQGLAYGAMYFRSLQAQCAWTTCPEAAAPAPVYRHAPGVEHRSIQTLVTAVSGPATGEEGDPSEWEPWPGASPSTATDHSIGPPDEAPGDEKVMRATEPIVQLDVMPVSIISRTSAASAPVASAPVVPASSQNATTPSTTVSTTDPFGPPVTMGAGFSAAAQAFFGADIGVYFVFDTKGNAGIMLSGAGRMGPDLGASVGLAGFGYYNATVPQVGGEGVAAGLDTPVGSAAWVVSKQDPYGIDSRVGVSISAGVGTQVGYYLSRGYSYILMVPATPMSELVQQGQQHWNRGDLLYTPPLGVMGHRF